MQRKSPVTIEVTMIRNQVEFVSTILTFLQRWRTALTSLSRSRESKNADVKAKATAAEEMAVASGVKNLMYAGSRITSSHILDDVPIETRQITLTHTI